MKRFYTLIIVCLLLIATALYFVIPKERTATPHLANISSNNIITPITPTEQQINPVENQSYTQLKTDAENLRTELKGFYSFHIRNDYPQSEQDLKAKGGDCYDYSRWYVKKALDMGYRAYTTRLAGREISHQIAIIYNEQNDYCIADQLNLWCVDVK